MAKNNYATKSPLVAMGCPTFTPKAVPSLRQSPPASNTPIHQPTPLATPNGVQIQSATILPLDRQTDRETNKQTDRWDRRQVCSNTSLRSMDCIATRLIIHVINCMAPRSSSSSYSGCSRPFDQLTVVCACRSVHVIQCNQAEFALFHITRKLCYRKDDRAMRRQK